MTCNTLGFKLCPGRSHLPRRRYMCKRNNRQAHRAVAEEPPLRFNLPLPTWTLPGSLHSVSPQGTAAASNYSVYHALSLPPGSLSNLPLGAEASGNSRPGGPAQHLGPAQVPWTRINSLIVNSYSLVLLPLTSVTTYAQFPILSCFSPWFHLIRITLSSSF